jgi:hypothetical protein
MRQRKMTAPTYNIERLTDHQSTPRPGDFEDQGAAWKKYQSDHEHEHDSAEARGRMSTNPTFVQL